jgi:Fur family ferric uptake transcriptional regulator
MPHCQSLLTDLRQRGFRITPQREMIVEIIAHADTHLTAEQIYAQVSQRTRTVNLATVYRTLELLVETGAVSRADLGQGQVSYAAQNHGAHIHLVCRCCGAVIDASHDLLETLHEQLQEKYQFAADLQHISIPGVCAGCGGQLAVDGNQ